MSESRETCPLCGVAIELTRETVTFDPRIIPIAIARGMDPAEYALTVDGANYEQALERHLDLHSKGELLAELMATRRLLLNVLRAQARV